MTRLENPGGHGARCDMRSKKAIQRERAKRQERKVAQGFAIFTIGLVVVLGGLQLLYFRYDARATNRANLSAHATLRAPFVLGQPLRLVSTIRNVGRTDAHDLSIRSVIVAGYFKSEAKAFEKVPVLSYRDPDTRLVLAADASFSEDLEDRTTFTPEDYANLSKGKMKVYFFSQMTYSDAFGALHQDQACEYFDPSTSVMIRCLTENSSR